MAKNFVLVTNNIPRDGNNRNKTTLQFFSKELIQLIWMRSRALVWHSQMEITHRSWQEGCLPKMRHRSHGDPRTSQEKSESAKS